jgi:predicted membrane protein
MSFHGGVGDVTLDFGGEWRAPAEANVKIGIGSLKVLLPRDLGVAITLSRFLASFDHDGFTKRGGVYYSDNYAAARVHLNLDVDAAFGGIEVHWLDGR